ncbi:hypothetical protein B0H63DRAFT_433496 [Podospora didyma]|uniref:FAD-binding domain-containing protein n=1 Tax=Podospora didyma TaxID=330526 RepID=A0AAE0NQE2_9PEZI|nr:hypothetical protein B0H63DRAFT_433496 [Podospora didyma]
MTTPVIAIIGAGPCGLTLARLLECKGIDYAVYERDESENTNRAGGSLDIHPETGQRALQECGLFDAFKKYARYDDTVLSLLDKSGKQHLQIGQGRDAPEIDRKELRQILLDAIPKDKTRWGHTLTGATLGEDGRPVLQFANGVVVSGFKLVVGTDGAWSKVRPLLTQATPQYSGKTYLEARINLDSPLYETLSKSRGAGTTISVGSGTPIITQRQGNGSYRTYFGLPVPADFFKSGGKVGLQDAEATRGLLLSDFYADGWSDDHKALIRHATDFRTWPLYSLSAEDMNWTPVPGATLAGDAAHLAMPNGEGVNLAMTDALNLADKIAEHGVENIDLAVREYEQEMFPRGEETISEGKAMTGIMYGEDPQPFVEIFSAFGAGGDGEEGEH